MRPDFIIKTGFWLLMSTISRLKCNSDFAFASMTGLWTQTEVQQHLVLSFLLNTDRHLNYLCKFGNIFPSPRITILSK